MHTLSYVMCRSSRFDLLTILASCYWWPLDVNINPKMAINSRNMTPEDLKFVERRITYETVNVPIGRKELAHPEDKAIYD